MLTTLDFVNFGGFRGFRFLDPPAVFRHTGLLVRPVTWSSFFSDTA